MIENKQKNINEEIDLFALIEIIWSGKIIVLLITTTFVPKFFINSW